MKIIIAGNWKCNPSSLSEAKKLFNLIEQGIKKIEKNALNKLEIIICPPFVYLSQISGLSSYLKLGGQDCFWQNPRKGKGSFTGEISPLMLKKIGLKYVIIGHSERRKYQQESDQIINKKIKSALQIGLKPIVCIADLKQLKNSLKGIEKPENIIIAYEPLFAIGTGKACSWEKAKEIRQKIGFKRVLYGGSVNSNNALDYIKKAGYQGLLIGGASLKPNEFIKIIKQFV